MFGRFGQLVCEGLMQDAGQREYSFDECTSRVNLTGRGATASCFAIADFSQSAIAAAVFEVQRLRYFRWKLSGAASVDRALSIAWCIGSVKPLGWDLPASWDEFSGDYRASDGWIRLHTNASHHRLAVLSVLGNPANKQQASKVVAGWGADALEQAVVDAGGAAAVMRDAQAWKSHAQGIAVNAEPVVAWKECSHSVQENTILDRATPERPLQGVRVLDLTRVLAGPVCTRFLASLGAEVLRIDPPGWEEDANLPEMTLGKRCAGLDLNLPDDRAVFEELIRGAHVLVHGYRRNALESMGFGSVSRAALNPRLIDVALNAYGWSGPWANRRGFDSLVQMSSGIAEYGQCMKSSEQPVPLPYQALDHVTGYLMAAAAIRAICEQLTQNRTMEARLSLARQARLLWDMSELPEDVVQAKEAAHAGFQQIASRVGSQHYQVKQERTPWGGLHRLKLPYQIEGVETGFDHPVDFLRSSQACWLVSSAP